MKSVALSFFLLILSAGLKAQTEQYLIKRSSKGSYIEHKVSPKENFYSIGRLFNVHPKHLASFNSLDMSKGLHIGQVLKIPLTDTNYTHRSEIGRPVYYVTGNEETIYNVSTNNDVLMEKLRKWNKVTTDKLPRGAKLVVGYLMSPTEMATAVNNPQTTETETKPITDNKEKEIVKNEVTTQPGIKKEEPKKDSEVVQEKKEVKDEPAQSKKTEDVIPVKEEVKPQNPGEGYFRISFDKQIKQDSITKEQTVTSGIFKTSSGWSDAKYYLLMDGAEPGTIVKITNPINDKIIYAKLLGEMTDLKQNEGLNIRISNAAAAALDIPGTDRFTVKLDY
jgi:LysM repeat protein